MATDSPRYVANTYPSKKGPSDETYIRIGDLASIKTRNIELYADHRISVGSETKKCVSVGGKSTDFVSLDGKTIWTGNEETKEVKINGNNIRLTAPQVLVHGNLSATGDTAVETLAIKGGPPRLQAPSEGFNYVSAALPRVSAAFDPWSVLSNVSHLPPETGTYRLSKNSSKDAGTFTVNVNMTPPPTLRIMLCCQTENRAGVVVANLLTEEGPKEGAVPPYVTASLQFYRTPLESLSVILFDIVLGALVNQSVAVNYSVLRH